METPRREQQSVCRRFSALPNVGGLYRHIVPPGTVAPALLLPIFGPDLVCMLCDGLLKAVLIVGLHDIFRRVDPLCVGSPCRACLFAVLQTCDP